MDAQERRKGKGVRVAALADVHCGRGAEGKFKDLFAQMAAESDVIALCGDLTDYGLAEEAAILVRELQAAAHVPILAVFGNHDYESGEITEVRRILREGGVHVLEGDAFEHEGVGFAGAKGFMGGFGMHCLQEWGEDMTKKFVAEALAEEMRLEKALGHLQTETRVVLLHYAPIEDTIVGEPVEIFPFLGCSRLEEPIDRYGVAAVFHGHAHAGTFEGRTFKGVPVYNVALPVLRRERPGAPPFFLWEAPHAPQRQEGAPEVLRQRPGRA
jgi:Icc-related predicted phosphoesterase